MNKTTKFHKFDVKNKKKFFNNGFSDEEPVSFKEVKREKQTKHFKNYENALKTKDLDLLLSYEEN